MTIINPYNLNSEDTIDWDSGFVKFTSIDFDEAEVRRRILKQNLFSMFSLIEKK
jgi:hypothetical protein